MSRLHRFGRLRYSYPEIIHADELLPMPVALDTSTHAITSNLQPGSQLMYLKPSTGELPVNEYEPDLIYWWDGAAIVDKTGSPTNAQGVAYGSDPYQPSAAVRRWKHLAACMPTKYGRPAGKRVGDLHGSLANPTPRQRFPDFVFLERGEVLNQEADLAGFLAFSPTAYAENNFFNLTLRGAAYGVCCFAACGDPQLPMPKIQDPAGWGFVVNTGGDVSNTRYVGIHFDGTARNATYLTGSGGQVAISTNYTSGTNFVVRDCLFDQCAQIGLPSSGSSLHASLTRCTIVGSHSLREAINSAIDSHGTDDSMLSLIDTWVIDGGYRFNPLKIRDPALPVYSAAVSYAVGELVRSEDGRRVYVAQPGGAPAGSAFPADNSVNAAWRHVGLDGVPVGTNFDRNTYCASPTHMLRSGTLRGGSSGQIRHYGRVEKCVLYQGGMIVAKARQAPYVSGDPDGSTLPQGHITDSVLLRFVQPPMHPGWGLKIGVGVQDGLIARNVISNAQHAISESAVHLDAAGWEGSGYRHGYATRRCRVEDNIGDCGTAPFLTAQDGAANVPEYGYVAPGLIGNTASRNVAVSTAESQLQYKQLLGAPTTTDTVVDGTNIVHASTAAAGWPAPDRTIKTWLASLGVAVPAADLDGVNTLIDIVRGQHAYTGGRAIGGGYFPAELRPIALRNHIAGGRNLQALT